jgi:hypothetical protein
MILVASVNACSRDRFHSPERTAGTYGELKLLNGVNRGFIAQSPIRMKGLRRANMTRNAGQSSCAKRNIERTTLLGDNPCIFINDALYLPTH